MNNWVFIALPIAGGIHIFEEYVYPGGFQNALSKAVPRMATPFFTPKFHLVINSLFIVMCFASAFIGETNLILSMSVISLIFVNSVMHIRGVLVTKKYYPGVISGALIYIPFAIYAYSVFLSSGQLTWIQASISFLLGVLYMGIPIIYVFIRHISKIVQESSKK